MMPKLILSLGTLNLSENQCPLKKKNYISVTENGEQLNDAISNNFVRYTELSVLQSFVCSCSCHIQIFISKDVFYLTKHATIS